jgi:hypothetical protein
LAALEAHVESAREALRRKRTAHYDPGMGTNLEIQRRTVRLISRDLDIAIAFFETFVPTGQDARLIDIISNIDFYPAFNIISDSLHKSVITTLCRIWDTRKDTANLNKLAKKFRDPKVIADLAAAHHVVDPGHLNKWLAEIDAVKKSEELLALKRARHDTIAHTTTPNKPYRDKARVAQYGDERKIIEWTIPLVEQAGTFIGYSYDVIPYAEQRRVRREHATKFWANIASSS